DDVEKLNLDGAAAVAQLIFRLAAAVADRPQLPAFRSAAPYEGPNEQQIAETASYTNTARLGITWDERRAAKGDIHVSEVDSGSAAESAGIRPGDRIIRL